MLSSFSIFPIIDNLFVYTGTLPQGIHYESTAKIHKKAKIEKKNTTKIQFRVTNLRKKTRNSVVVIANNVFNKLNL